jgi:hypothetical protein
MKSNHYCGYGSAEEFLADLKQDKMWLSMLQLLQNFSQEELDEHIKEACEQIRYNGLYSPWYFSGHRVELVVDELWKVQEMSMTNLRMLTIWMLSVEWIEAQDSGVKAAEPQAELNRFAPKKNLQELLKEEWFAEVRSDEKYDAVWTDGFIGELMASEYGEGIARQWAVEGARQKRNQIKAYVVGLLKDAGVLKGSYIMIGNKTGLNNKERTFSTDMSRGKKQPYAAWVKESVAGNFSSLTEKNAQTFGS